jgi:hypothetical protein
MIGTYRNRPVRIEAVQWDGSRKSEEEISMWARPRVRGSAAGSHLTLRTPRGNERARPGDWIVKCANGQFRLVKAEEFAETFELVME